MTSRDVNIHLKSGESTASTNSEDNEIVTSKLTSETVPSHQGPLCKITIHIESIALYDPLSLASLVPSLRKDGLGQVLLKIPSDVDAAPLHTSIMLAGLTSQSEKTTDDGYCCITAIYKPKSKHSSAAIKINTNKNNSSQAIRINIGDLTDEDDLINEDDLLTSAPNEINAPTEVDVAERQKQLDDCGGRKACDNCTCGRKEMEEAGDVKKVVAAEVPTSSCGNCAKGDAFRCAGCPYLGKPAFKEGEEHLVLDLTDDL